MRFFFLFLTILTFLKAELYRQVQITFQEMPEAHYYEIEWLEKKPKSNRIEGLVEIVYSSPLKKKIEAKYRYFRMRSVRGKNYSAWTSLFDLGPLTEKYTWQEKKEKELEPQQKTIAQKEKETEEKRVTPEIREQNPSQIEKTPSEKSSKEAFETSLENLAKENGSEDKEKIQGEKETPLSESPVDFEKLSGEKPAYYSLDEKEEKEYQGPIPLEEEREYQIRLLRQNKQSFYEGKIIMDFTPPETQLGVYQPVIFDGSRLWVSENSPIELLAKDSGSRVKTTLYRVYEKEEDAKNFQEYTGSFRLVNFSLKVEEMVWIEFYSEDFAGNKEKPKRVALFADNKAPQISKIQANDKGENEIFFIERNPPVYYKITSKNGQKFLEGQTKNYLLLPKLPSGEYLLEFWDNFENKNNTSLEIP